MRKILIVQSRITEKRIERERENYRRTIGDRADVDFLSSLDGRLAWTSPIRLLDGYSGVIFGGSSDFDFHGGRPENDPIRLISTMILSRARNIISHALQRSVPILGVCFGHQIIGQMHRGMVTNDREQSKFGSFEVQLTPDGKRDKIFGTLPATFYAQYAHKDSVTNHPEGATVLATGPGCKFAALRYGESVYTVQFHPELEKFDDILSRHPSPDASKIIPLWLEKIVK
jgi:GMP synthase-like glutamine amidotransferase